MRTNLAPDRTFLIRLAPLLAGVLGAIAACIGASVQGLPLPLDVAGVFLVLGLAATWIARATPVRGALFLLLLAAVVVLVAYVS
jgi:hypothetical protein